MENLLDGLGCCPFQGGNFIVTYNLYCHIVCIVTLCVCGGGCVRFLFCGVVLCVLSSLAAILLRKRDLVALLYLYSDCWCSVSSVYHSAVGWSAVYLKFGNFRNNFIFGNSDKDIFATLINRD